MSRPEATRDQQKAILISLEDTQSSKLYFESFQAELRTHRVIVIAEHAGSSPKNVVDAATRARDARKEQVKAGLEDPFDEIWVVFDTEGPQNVQRNKDARNAIEQARQLTFSTAVSNPSFEYWLLLHFAYNVSSIANGNQACKLLKHHIKGYEKSMNCYELTRSRVDDAIKNARRVFKERCEYLSQHPCDCHPCTEVFRLVESLLGYA